MYSFGPKSATPQHRGNPTAQTASCMTSREKARNNEANLIRWDISSPHTHSCLDAKQSMESVSHLHRMIIREFIPLTRSGCFQRLQLIVTRCGEIRRTFRHMGTQLSSVTALFHRTFGANESLPRLFSSVDESRFYLDVSFPDILIDVSMYGLFSQWISKLLWS
jgi:hypothetical protein